MSILRRFNGRAVAGMAALCSTVTVGACADDDALAGPDSKSTVAFAQDPFSGPKSVPTRGRIVFTSIVTGDSEIFSIMEDGTGLVRHTYNPGIDNWPAISPDGKKILFSSVRDGDQTPNLYTMNVDGSGIKKLTSYGASEAARQGAWSADGKKIVFVHLKSGGATPTIEIMGANGSTPVWAAHAPGFNQYPTFSPDGKKIAFGLQSNNGGVLESEIVTLTLETGTLTWLTICANAGFYCSQPAWSPDGTRMAYTVGELVCGSSLCGRIDVRNLATQAVTTVAATGNYPVWSPDGVRIAYNANALGIGTVGPLGTNPQVIGPNGAAAHTRSWGQ